MLKVHYTGLNYIITSCRQEDALVELEKAVTLQHVIDKPVGRLVDDIKKRERLGSTEIYPGIMMPHINEPHVNQTTVVVTRFPQQAEMLGHSGIRAAIFVLTNGATDALAEFMHLLVDPRPFEYLLDRHHTNEDVKNYFIKGGEN